MANYSGYILSGFSSLGRNFDVESFRLRNFSGWDFFWNTDWGSVSSPFNGWNTNWDQDWSALNSGFVRTRRKVYIPELLGATTFSYTDNRPLSLRNFNFSGYRDPSYFDIFYNKILVEPTYLDFGTVISEQSLDITVFNAYFEQRLLSDLVKTKFDSGMIVVGDSAPIYFYPLEEKTYTLTVKTAGPPNIDAILAFDFGAYAYIEVEIVGSRIVLFPVTYRSRVKETLVWKTDVLNSYNGTEQRVRQRLSPRQQLAVEVYVNRDERRHIENLMYGWRQRIWAIPMWIEARYADSPLDEGDMTIDVSTLYGDFRTEHLAVIWESPRKYDVFQIASMDDVSITLDRGVNDDYANPIIMPVRSARMMRDPKRLTTGYDGDVSAIFEVTDNIRFKPGAADDTFNGVDLWFEEPLMPTDEGVEDHIINRMDLIDYEIGTISLIAPWTNTRIRRRFDQIKEGLEEIWNFRQWLHRRSGRLVPFYMPTYENNFEILTEGTLTDVIEIRNDGFVSQSSARTHIIFFLKNGSWIIKTIIGSASNPSGTDSITLDSELNVSVDNIDIVSFLGLKRLQSDRVELTWLPNNVITSTLGILEIEP